MSRVARRFALVTTTAFLLGLATVYSIGAAHATEIVSESTSLRPGQFVWRPDAASAGEVEIVVSLPLQRAYVYRGGTLIGVSTVSTGQPGYETPVGSFNILQKRREHYSNRYNNAPMPFMQRLTWDGVALHAGEIPDRPASHGCIRLPHSFAKKLYNMTSHGTRVTVTKKRFKSAEDALDLI